VSPNFTKTKSRPLERDYVNEAEPMIDKFKAAMMKKVSETAKPVKQPSSTRSMALLQQNSRAKINADVKAEQAKKNEDILRKEQ
jgi:hypothetical protein